LLKVSGGRGCGDTRASEHLSADVFLFSSVPSLLPLL
jgi:hypothetical protein